MKSTQKLIRKTELKSNCPECYTTEGLNLEFYQTYVDSYWYKRFLNQLSSKMYCTKCDTEIFPVSWTPDIERLFDYHKKGTKMRSSRHHWKTVTFVVIFAAVALITASVIIWLNYSI